MIIRVMVSCEKVEVIFDDGKSLCGFVKNEYVWATSEERAIAKAKQRILSALAENSAIRLLDDSEIAFNIDEVESGVAPWKLLANEGFVFYRLDSASSG